MFRAVIKNAGLKDQSTIFILEICFSYREIQVSRPSVNSVTQSTISMRNGLRYVLAQSRGTPEMSCSAGGGAAPAGLGLRAWGRPESAAAKRSPAGSSGTTGAGLLGPERSLGPLGRQRQRRRRRGQHGGPDAKSRSLDCSSRGAEAQEARLPQPRCLHGTLPATAGQRGSGCTGLDGYCRFKHSGCKSRVLITIS